MSSLREREQLLKEVQMEQSKSSATLRVNKILTWQPVGQDFNSQCHLLIYYFSHARAMVIVTELANNPGQSITATVTQLIHLVCYRFGLAPYKVMWLEHYPPGVLNDEDSYEQVMLALGHFIRQRVSQQSLERLLGCSL